MLEIKNKICHIFHHSAFAFFLFFLSSQFIGACSSSSTKPKDNEKEEATPPIKVPTNINSDPSTTTPNVVSKKPRNPVNFDRKDVTFHVLNEAVTSLQMQLNNLWMTNQVEMTPQIKPDVELINTKINTLELTPLVEATEIQIVINDLNECGFSYDGPECLENYNPVPLLVKLVRSSLGKDYLYVLSSYQNFKLPLVFLYELPNSSKTLPNITTADHIAYVFALSAEADAYSIADVLNENSSQLLFHTNFKKFDAITMLEKSSQASSARQLVNLLADAYQASAVLVPQSAQQLEEKIYQQLLTSEAQLAKAESGFIQDHYLSLLENTATAANYLKHITQFALNYQSSLGQESALRILGKDPQHSGLETLVSLSLRGKDKDTLRRALNLVNDIDFPINTNDILTLIQHMIGPEEDFSDLSRQILVDQNLEESHLKKYDEILHNSIHSEVIADFSFGQLVRFKDKDIARKSLLKSINHSFLELQKKAAETLPSLDLQADDISILQKIVQSSSLSSEVLSSLGLAAELIFTTDAFNLIYENVDQSEEKLRIEYLVRLQRMFEKSKELISSSTAVVVMDKLKSTYKEVRIFSALLSPLQPSLEMTTAIIAILSDEEKYIRDLGFEYLMAVNLEFLDYRFIELLKPLMIAKETSIEDSIKVIDVFKRMQRNKVVLNFAIENFDNPNAEIQSKLLELVQFHKINNEQCSSIKVQLEKKYDLPIRIDLLSLLSEVVHFACFDDKIDLLLLENEKERNLVLLMVENDFIKIFEDPKSPVQTKKNIININLKLVLRNSPFQYIREKMFLLLQNIDPLLTHQMLAELLIIPETDDSNYPQYNEWGPVEENSLFLNLAPTPDICENVFRILKENPISIPKEKSQVIDEDIVFNGFMNAFSKNIPQSNCLGGAEFVYDYLLSEDSFYSTKYLIVRIQFMEEGPYLNKILEALGKRPLDKETYVTEIGALLKDTNKLYVRKIGLELLKLVPENTSSTIMLVNKFYQEPDLNIRSEQMQMIEDRLHLIDQSMHHSLVNAVKNSKFQDAQIFAAKVLSTQKDLTPNVRTRFEDLLKTLKDEKVLEAIREALIKIDEPIN